MSKQPKLAVVSKKPVSKADLEIGSKLFEYLKQLGYTPVNCENAYNDMVAYVVLVDENPSGKKTGKPWSKIEIEADPRDDGMVDYTLVAVRRDGQNKKSKQVQFRCTDLMQLETNSELQFEIARIAKEFKVKPTCMKLHYRAMELIDEVEYGERRIRDIQEEIKSAREELNKLLDERPWASKD